MKEQLLPGSETTAAYSYEEVLAIVLQLTIEEQLKIMEELLSAFRQKIVAAPLQVSEEVAQPEIEEQSLQVSEEATQPEIEKPPLHSIMEFEGFGKKLWEGVDVEAYLNEERNSWDR